MSVLDLSTNDLRSERGKPARSAPSSSLITHHSSLAIYVHIPFCVRKCYYCDFNSGPSSAEMREYYVQALCAEIRQSRVPTRSGSVAGSPARTVFYGGGT